MPTHAPRFCVATSLSVLSGDVCSTFVAESTASPSCKRLAQLVLRVAVYSTLAVFPFLFVRSDRSAEVSLMKPRLTRPRLIDLTTDPQNTNRGTDRGRAALER